MADIQLDNKGDITLSSITDKIKKADQTAREMYTRLDRFMEASARKEKNAKDEAGLSKSKEPRSNEQPQKDPAAKQETAEAVKDMNADELMNSVMGEVSDQLSKANLQADTLELQEDLNTQTILNAVNEQNKQVPPPVVQNEAKASESMKPPQPVEQTELSKVSTAEPIEIKVTTEPKQSEKTDRVELPRAVEPVEPPVATTVPSTNKTLEETKLDMPVVSQTPAVEPVPVQELPVLTTSTTPELQENTKDLKPEITKTELPTVVEKPLEVEVAKEPVADVAETINPSEPTLPDIFETPQVSKMSPASNNIEDFLKAPQDVIPDVSIPEATETPVEPFIASKEPTPAQEFPNIVASAQATERGSSLNLTDESLVTIGKSLDNMSQQMKQNQEKLATSISNLNSTAVEILKILPTLQQRNSDQPMKVVSNSQTHSIDTSNMIGNFRDSLNLTTKGYNRNTVFPGNNSIV
jgi:hypothetical protein